MHLSWYNCINASYMMSAGLMLGNAPVSATTYTQTLIAAQNKQGSTRGQSNRYLCGR